jgi:hypothetical protein
MIAQHRRTSALYQIRAAIDCPELGRIAPDGAGRRVSGTHRRVAGPLQSFASGGYGGDT